MQVVNLVLRNFRNYDKLNIEFCNGLNVIIGNNAQGKTNILESIYVLGLTKTFYSSLEKSTIKIGNEFSLISGKILSDDLLYELSVVISNYGKNVKINGVPKKKISDYISHLRIVLFTPDDIKFLKNFPSNRRKFLNMEICQISKIYLQFLNFYNSVMKQRNFYLKSVSDVDNVNMDYLNVIDEKLINYSDRIYLLRKEFIYKINKYIGEIFKNISQLDGLEIKYISNYTSKEEYRNALKSNLKRDIQLKSTSIGIHRDDFVLELNGHNLAVYGSQGQVRMAILALKIAEAYVYKDYGLEFPVLLLDDVFSELDVNKRNNLTKYLRGNIQVILTTTDLNMISDDLLKNARIFYIENGCLKQVKKEEI